MNKWVDWIAKSYFDFQYKQFIKAEKSGEKIQHNILLSLIKKTKNTVFGNEHNFSQIEDYKSFCKHVPIRSYEEIEPYIKRMLNGEQQILWPKVNKFSKSSGTSAGVSKYIPVSVESLSESNIKTGKHYLSCYLNENPNSRFFYGKGIVLTGNFYEHDLHQDVEIADVSMLLYAHTDRWINHFKAIPLEVAKLSSWEKKIEQIAKSSIHGNITNISGVPSWILILLKKVKELSGKNAIAEVWPNLELITHGGVDFTPYKTQFEQLIGKSVNYRNVYNASEGFFAFQTTTEDDLSFDFDNGIFYELECIKTNKVILPHNAQVESIYNLIITTNAGLFRYKIGDRIKIKSTQPFRFQLAGRDKLFLNVVGEELIQANTDKAITICCNFFECSISEYTIAPNFETNTQITFHEWAIEFETLPNDICQFTEKLDTILCQLNSDYAAKRKGDLALGQLKINVVRKGKFLKWLSVNNKTGVQAKIPRLMNERKIIEYVINI